MNFFYKIKALHKNYGLGYWVFIGLFFSAFYLMNKVRDSKWISDIYHNLELTKGKTIGMSKGGYSCSVMYIYSASGKYYLGTSGCYREDADCKEFAVAYSKKDPKKSVLLLDFPLEKTNYIGEIIDKHKYKVTEEVLLKWIEHKNLYSSQTTKTYTLKEYQKMNPCKE